MLVLVRSNRKGLVHREAISSRGLALMLLFQAFFEVLRRSSVVRCCCTVLEHGGQGEHNARKASFGRKGEIDV